jgi:hypothetical protein
MDGDYNVMDNRYAMNQSALQNYHNVSALVDSNKNPIIIDPYTRHNNQR